MSHRLATGAYGGLWRVLANWFRVPEEPPDLPVEAGEAIDRFQPAPGFLAYLKLWFWIISIIIDLALLGGLIAAAIALIIGDVWFLLIPILPAVIVLMIVPDIVGYIAVHLRYDTTWYVMTDRSMRIRRGIFSIRETTITFENVQNIKVEQGPVERSFGIGTLIVETAGSGGGSSHGSGAARPTNVGVIEGVADAAALRERILPQLRGSLNAGLGDENGPPASGWTAEHIGVLREIHGVLTHR